MIEGAQCLVQFKLRPDVITPDNVHTNIFLSSMVDSPLDSLYYMIKSVFSPALRSDSTTKSSSTANQQIQTSLSELEEVLRNTGKKSGGSSSSTGSVNHPKDELVYWTEISRSGSSKAKEIERATYFLELLDPVKKEFNNLEK